MISPFLNPPEGLFDDYQPIDPDKIKRIKYARLHLKYKNKLHSTRSLTLKDNYQYVKLKKQHNHINHIGILMVENKKPFKTRFK